MKIQMLNYQAPLAVEICTDCYEVLCASKTDIPGSSTEDFGDLEDFLGKGL